MKYFSSALIIVATAAGAFLLRFSLLNSSADNYFPTCLPLPARGFSVGGLFALPSGGQFALEVITPAAEVERHLLHREKPPVQCDLVIVLTGPSGFRSRRLINRLHNGGWTSDTDIYFPDSLIDLPAGGRYTITLVSGSTVNQLSDRGALVQLARFEPTGHELLAPIAGVAAYGCFALVVLLTLVTLRRKIR
jgi:hypothetical protein